MLNILWLASWYPNKYDPYNGDFIQRHALAVSKHCDLHVITIQFVPDDWQQPLAVKEQVNQKSFTETIIYLKHSSLPAPLNKALDQWNYMRSFKKEIQLYVATQKPSLVHVHVPVKAGIVGLWMKKKYSLPLVVSEHWGIYNDHAPDKFSKRSWWFKTLVKRVISSADVFLPVSKDLGDSVNRLVVKKQFKVIKNAVDLDVFMFNSMDKKNNNAPFFWLIHVSMMNAPKNPEGLLRAFALAVKSNKNLRLRIVGQASEQHISYAKQLGVGNYIEFAGMQPQKNVAKLMRQSDAFFLFSNYENMPCVIAEAMCCGLPIISTNVGGIPEVVQDHTGILMAAGDEEAAANAILQLSRGKMHYDRGMIALSGMLQFSYHYIGDKFLEVYEKLLHE